MTDTQSVNEQKRGREIIDSVARQIAEPASAALAAFSPDQIAGLPIASLTAIQGLLRHGDQFGIWRTPPEWLNPADNESREGTNLRSRILHFLRPVIRNRLDQSFLDEGVAQLTRYLILLRIGPSGLGRASLRSLSPTAVLNIAYNYAPNLIAIALTRRLEQTELSSHKLVHKGNFLSQVRLGDLRELTNSANKYVRRECQRMRMLSDLGLWPDAPSLEEPSLGKAMLGPKPTLGITPERDPHRPLPDEYVSMLGTRTLWVVKDLGPNILALAGKFKDIWTETEDEVFSPVTVRDRRRNAVKDALASHIWETSNGQPIDRLPFPFVLQTPRGFAVRPEPENGDESVVDEFSEAVEIRWPPKNYSDFTHLLGTLQAAHLVVTLLSIGSRRSEILSLTCDCVVYALDGRPYAEGRTFKLVERHDGELRDWQLPELAIEAIEQQTRLIDLCESIGYLTPRRIFPQSVSTSLWRKISSSQTQCDPVKPLRDIGKLLIRYARTLGLDTHPGGQQLRTHRFRKTLARLVALALTQAPKLLMDVFGHKSLEMTLYYILTDKTLRAEIEIVSRELRVMRAKEVVDAMVAADLASSSDERIDFGGYGGIAAISVNRSVQAKIQEVHRTGAVWGAQNAIELAELLTLQGTEWQQVRLGVVCTKLPGEAGPCNRSKGRPEPSKCSTKCEHRLEDAFLREDVDASLACAVAGYESAITSDDEMTAASWAGQIRANLPRFPTVQQKWATHPIVKKLMLLETAS